MQAAVAAGTQKKGGLEVQPAMSFAWHMFWFVIWLWLWLIFLVILGFLGADDMLMPEKYMLIDFNNFKPIRFMSALVLLFLCTARLHFRKTVAAVCLFLAGEASPSKVLGVVNDF